MALRLRYTGGGYGGAINGVPARDLTDEDIQRLKLDTDALVEGGLYAVVELAFEPEEEVKAERPGYADKSEPHTLSAYITRPDGSTVREARRGRRRIVEDKTADEGSG